MQGEDKQSGLVAETLTKAMKAEFEALTEIMKQELKVWLEPFQMLVTATIDNEAQQSKASNRYEAEHANCKCMDNPIMMRPPRHP